MAELVRRHGAPGLSSVVIERVFWLEGEINLEKLNPLYQTASSQSRLEVSDGPVVEIAYRPATWISSPVLRCAV